MKRTGRGLVKHFKNMVRFANQYLNALDLAQENRASGVDDLVVEEEAMRIYCDMYEHSTEFAYLHILPHLKKGVAWKKYAVEPTKKEFFPVEVEDEPEKIIKDETKPKFGRDKTRRLKRESNESVMLGKKLDKVTDGQEKLRKTLASFEHRDKLLTIQKLLSNVQNQNKKLKISKFIERELDEILATKVIDLSEF